MPKQNSKDILKEALLVYDVSTAASFTREKSSLHGNVTAGHNLAGGTLARDNLGYEAKSDSDWIESANRIRIEPRDFAILARIRRTREWTHGDLIALGAAGGKFSVKLYMSPYVPSVICCGIYAGNWKCELPSIIKGQPALVVGEWYDIIIQHTSGTIRIFINGVLYAYASTTMYIYSSEYLSLRIYEAFKGEIDIVAIWPRSLHEDEIMTLSGGKAAVRSRREEIADVAEVVHGRANLTLGDQLRAARELQERLYRDQQRPRYHLMPLEGTWGRGRFGEVRVWNDINGTLYWKGRYHIFFLGRTAPDRELILSGQETADAREVWLHASSRDLVHWIHHPPALVPEFGSTYPCGIFSGDAIEGAPVPTLIYHVPTQGICIAIAEDDELVSWKPIPQNPVIPENNDCQEIVVFDPCAWKEGDYYFALIGNKNLRGGFEGDSTNLFRTSDLIHWEYLGPFYKSNRRWTAEIADCACPDFFPLGDRHMLLMHVHMPYGHAQYYIGRWDRQAQQFYPEVHGRMCWPGGQLEGPETLQDNRGRRILWGWIRGTRPATNGWSDVASLPRVLSLDANNQLLIRPAEELEALRSEYHAFQDLNVTSELSLTEIRNDCLEIYLVATCEAADEYGIKVRCSPDGAEETAITYIPGRHVVRIDLTKSSLDPDVTYYAVSPIYAQRLGLPADQITAKSQEAPFELQSGEPLQLRIFVDRSVLEVFVNGRQCLTQRIYPIREDSLGISLVANGGTMRARSVQVWYMSPSNNW